MNEQLLEILVCPETKTSVALADQSLINRVNIRITDGLQSRGGKEIKQLIEGGLVREDGMFLYPIVDDVPIMMIEEAISLSGV